jgi:hypothetical protein
LTPQIFGAKRSRAGALPGLSFAGSDSTGPRRGTFSIIHGLHAPGQQGSRYFWTRKVRAKTVTVALSQEQYLWLKQAVANQRNLERIVEQMQIFSRRILFENVLGVVRRQHLTKKVLGLI